jgi:hypothetical protein
MTKDAVIQQFDACIVSLEEEIARIESGACDDAALDKLSGYSLKPEFRETVGKYW